MLKNQYVYTRNYFNADIKFDNIELKKKKKKKNRKRNKMAGLSCRFLYVYPLLENFRVA